GANQAPLYLACGESAGFYRPLCLAGWTSDLAQTCVKLNTGCLIAMRATKRYVHAQIGYLASADNNCDVSSPINTNTTPAYKIPVALWVFGIFSVCHVSHVRPSALTSPASQRSATNKYHERASGWPPSACKAVSITEPRAQTAIRTTMAAAKSQISRLS